MKKLFFGLSLLISFECLAETRTLKAPFTELKFEKNVTTSGKLVIPAMVAQSVYIDAVKQDCQQFQDTVSKYAAQLSSDEVKTLVTSPLAYSMKANYEVEVTFPTSLYQKLESHGELNMQFASTPLELEWKGNDLLKGVLNPLDGVQLAESNTKLRVKFTRRDLFCGYLAETLKLQIGYSVFWKLDEMQNQIVERNLNLLTAEIEKILKRQYGDKLTAALAGNAFSEVLHYPEFNAERRFSSVDYFWTLLFANENSIQKTSIWQRDSEGNYQQEALTFVELRGLQL